MEYGTSENEKNIIGPMPKISIWILVNMHDIIESEGVQKHKSSSLSNMHKCLYTDTHFQIFSLS